MSRIGVPSESSEAKASASACAQSMPPSGPTAARRLLELAGELRVDREALGQREQLLVEALERRSAGTAVVTSGDGERSSS